MVDEPDVSPLAIQGPRAEDLVARVFGEEVRDIRFFRYAMLPFRGRHLVVARSGYSKQGGFEIYVDGSDLGEPLWDALFAAGEDLEVRPGCPNLIERIEARLLSYGNDMTRENTPQRMRSGPFLPDPAGNRLCWPRRSFAGCGGRPRAADQEPFHTWRCVVAMQRNLAGLWWRKTGRAGNLVRPGLRISAQMSPSA